ncbi:MAG TPA: ATP-binding protein [Streptosporangiaceae bacterium]|nr:ATP-binding protein [Streptosporangiaceae bacterium]
MARELCFADAVRLLGGQDEKVTVLLDGLAGGLVRAASVTGAGFVLGLFDAKSQLVRLSSDVIRDLSDRASGLSRVARSERLEAAHAVVALVAYFEAVRAASLPFSPRDLEITRAEQVSLAGGEPPADKVRNLTLALLRADVPVPAPQWPYEITLQALAGFYDHLSREVLRFIEGLSIWDQLDDRRQQACVQAFRSEVPGRAIDRYEELFRDLATAFPEVRFWANAIDHQATRQQVRSLETSLAGLKAILETLPAGQMPDSWRESLATAYHAALDRPVLSSADMPGGLQVPTLGDAYIDPHFRAAQVDASDPLAKESWWHQHLVREDLHQFLAGHLTSPQAFRAPLLILGQPGSGKSVLTKALAAQLPPSQFLAVRVALREVPADADVQTQTEFAIRSETGERMDWPALSRAAAGALPVIMLDGFDELLQATGASQSDYLEKVAEFQRREADLGRPVAVLVTSRTAVADRVRTVPGVVAIKLEPFANAQVTRWVGIWNTHNAAALEARGLGQLEADSVLAQPGLAAQPLLLVMLAIYDAEANALQTDRAVLERGDLYERLLRSFADREVRKAGAGLTNPQISQAVEDELLRLSVVAFAMFIRGRQWATAAELDADLSALLPRGDESRHLPAGMRAPLTASETAIGRFFFVHEARAVRGSEQLRTYEFLHATFAEYLVGRLVANELADIAAASQLSANRHRLVDDAFLHALLSFVALATRSTAVSFLAGRLEKIPGTYRSTLGGLLLGLFRESMRQRRVGPYDSYQPAPVPVPARHAAYSANLLLLILLISREVTAKQLYPDSTESVSSWRQSALLWKSQLAPEGWNGMVHTLKLDRTWDGGQRALRITLGDYATPTPDIDLYWSYNRESGSRYRDSQSRWHYYRLEDLRRHFYFTCDTPDDTVFHAIEPFTATVDPPVGTIHATRESRAVSSVNALIALWLTAGRSTASNEEIVRAHETCLDIALQTFYFDVSLEKAAQREFCELTFRQLAADLHRLPPDWLTPALGRIRAARAHSPDLAAITDEILGDVLDIKTM